MYNMDYVINNNITEWLAEDCVSRIDYTLIFAMKYDVIRLYVCILLSSYYYYSVKVVRGDDE